MEKILSDQVVCYAARKYQESLLFFGQKGAKISAVVDKLTEDERTLMEFLYGTMPLCDAADYEPELFCSYVKHGLFLRKNCPWTRELPEELFLNYVLCHRVNNEAITDCRSWFYEMLGPFNGYSLEEAVKEVNYWCASQASYAASDQRTLSPAAVFQSGSGRCGEESAFLVTALRSVGIAARQVYVPRWAHCDDNHAWVEVWIDGRWRFLGACEPEEVLDKGWFTNASSRAMLVHTRVFSDYFGTVLGKMEITERDGAAYLLNVTDTYAKTAPLTVLVKDENGNPVSGARVSFELLNMAEYHEIAALTTDKEGKVRLTLGLGSIQLHVSKGSCQRELFTQHGEAKVVEVILSEKLWQQDLESQKREWQYFDHKAPRDFPMHPVKLTREQKKEGRQRKQEAEQRRREKIREFERRADKFVEDMLERQRVNSEDGISGLSEEQVGLMESVLKAARGNSSVIVDFWKRHPKKEALDFLSVLSEKDYRDIREELLEEHFTYGRQVQDFSSKEFLKGEEHAKELFLQYVWNPRIGYEEITPYRSFITDTLTREQKEAFGREPERIWGWIQGLMGFASRESKDYSQVITSPAGVVRTRQGSFLAQKTLFVAVCRTLGIPARLHPVTQEAEYYKEHRFHKVACGKEGERQVRLIIVPMTPQAQAVDEKVGTSKKGAEYFASWTISRLNEESEGESEGVFKGFKTLDFSGREFQDGVMALLLTEGVYRLITTVRLPDGNQLEARRIVETKDFLPGEDGVPELVLPLHLRRPRLSQMLEELALEHFSLQGEDGIQVTDQEVMGECHTLLAFLEEEAEPTEHFLNELRERQQEVIESGLRIVFVVTGKEAFRHPTLANVRRLLGAQVYYDDFQELPESLARRMYTDPEKLPLVLLISPDGMGRYASSGYNVGSVGLLLAIADSFNK